MNENFMKQANHENSLNKNDCSVLLCNFSDIRHIFEEFHYKNGAMGGGISYCFAMVLKGKIVGGAVTGLPRHNKKYPNCVDIRRMACIDDSPKNSESYFLGKIIRFIASNTDFLSVLSYSDKTVGHIGTIYKASNFISVGETSKSKHIVWNGKQYHMRSLTIDRPYSYKLREAVKNGEAKIFTGESKIIWMYNISKKQKKKNVSMKNLHNKIKYEKNNKLEKSLFDYEI